MEPAAEVKFDSLSFSDKLCGWQENQITARGNSLVKKKKISTFWLRGTTLASCMAIMSCAILVIPGSILMGQARIISCNSQNYSCDFSSYKAGKARDVLHIGMALTIIGTSFLIFSCIYGALSNKRVKKVQNELEKEILSHSHTESIS